MNFEKALQNLKAGKLVTRQGWVKNVYIAIQKVTDKSKMTKDYIYIKDNNNHLYPIELGAKDLLANDWMLVYGDKEYIDFDKASNEQIIDAIYKKVDEAHKTDMTKEAISMMFNLSVTSGISKKEAFESISEAIKLANKNLENNKK